MHLEDYDYLVKELQRVIRLSLETKKPQHIKILPYHTSFQQDVVRRPSDLFREKNTRSILQHDDDRLG